MSAFFGMRGTGDWAANEVLENYRQGILRLYPNGSTIITGITSMMPSEKNDSCVYHWWEQSLPSQGGTFTAGQIYTDSAMSSAYTSGGLEDAILYVKVAEAIADEFRPGLNCILRDADDVYVDCYAKVKAVDKNGASSRITVKLLEADDNSTSHDLSDADTILITGSSQPQGSPIPDAVAYNPTRITNYSQTFETALDLSRNAIRQNLRTEDAYKKTKADALELHGVQMERAWIYSIPTEKTGDNGKLEYTTGGIKWFLKTYASSNVLDYTLDTGSYAGKTWLEGGEDWMDDCMELLFRYGSDQKLCLCGSGALLGIQKLVKSNGNMQLIPGTSIGYGIKVTSWVTSFGEIMLKTHPLLSYQPTDRYSMIIIEPKNQLKYTYIDDTTFKPDENFMKGGNSSIDGKKESWLTDAGLKMFHPSKGMMLYGVGQDNTVS